MTKWEHKLRLGDIFHAEDRPFEERRTVIVERIRNAPFWDEDDYDLVETITELEETDNIGYFDSVWDAFYDWCDQHRVWVETTDPEHNWEKATS